MTEIKKIIAGRGLGEEMFRLAVEACPNGMVMIDDSGKMVMVNTEIENQFGYARDELIGQPVDVLVPARLRAQHVHHRHEFIHTGLKKLETRRMGAGRELFGLRKDGTEFPVEVGLNPIMVGDAQLVLSVIVDISQRKEMERLKEEFVSTVSHELRTPLTSIAGSLGLLVGHWSEKLPDGAARLLSIAHSNSQRLVRLINDILDIEKIESGRVEFSFARVTVRTILEQAIEDNRGFAEGYGVNVRLDPGCADADINADPDRLSQVITNLLSNAVKYSPAGGEVMIGARREAEFVRIMVRDHGSGVPVDFRPRIFEKFAQADGGISKQKGGTGLGLSIVKQIVERLCGKVGFEDAPGGGTIFQVDLPLWDGSAGGEINVGAMPSGSLILLCDDDRAVSALLRSVLKPVGFAVDFAHTMGDAVARAAVTGYAAIVVDLQLGAADGIDLIVRIRAIPECRDTPILVLSVEPERGMRDVRSPGLNVLAWLAKPVDFRVLTGLLRTTASRQSQRHRVLHVDDDCDVRALVLRALQPFVDVVSADSVAAARRMLATDRFDLAILDVLVGSESGLVLIPELHAYPGGGIPAILFSTFPPPMPIDGRFHLAVSKSGFGLDKLVAAVGEQLALLPSKVETESA